MKRSIQYCLFWSGIIVFAVNIQVLGQDGLTIWANNGEDKVTRDELRATQDPSAVINSIWDGDEIMLFGARNEVVVFNLILEAATADIYNVKVNFDRLEGPGGNVIRSVPATGEGVFNWLDRHIELFYIRYLQIKGLSTDLFYDHYDERHIPERFRRPWTGDGEGEGNWQDRPDHDKFYPDIAVPLELVNSFDIKSGENQSIWVDIYIPKTVNYGLYTGTVTIEKNGQMVNQIPVELRVHNFTLPDLPNARTMVYFSQENINDRYLGNDGPEQRSIDYEQAMIIADRHFQIAHRHKMSLIDEYRDIDSMDESWTSRLSGDLFTGVNGYDGIGTGVGNNIYSIGTYGSWPWQEGTKAEMWNHSDAWVDWFDVQAFSTPTDYFLYLIDESDNYQQIEQWCQWMNNNPGPGYRLMSMATIDLPIAVQQTPSLDIPASWINVAEKAAWQNSADHFKEKPDKRVYLYNSNRPATGSFAIEDDGVALRALAWAQYKKHIDRWFYWESTYYHNYQGNTDQTNVFKNAQTFGDFERKSKQLGETGWNYLNGDGVLFYPGTDMRFPEDSYGVNGPFASLRLKHWRRGIQDVDYLTMAAEINPARTAEIVDTIIPKVLWEYGVSDPDDPTWILTDISWSTDPDVWENARAELVDIIESKTLTHRSKNDSPGDYSLCQNTPNPFNPTTSIHYQVGRPTHVQIRVTNILGERVCTLIDKYQMEGAYLIHWDGTNQEGIPVTSGLYFYEVVTAEFRELKKMMLVR